MHYLRKNHKKKSLHIQLYSFFKVIWCCYWLELWMWKSDSKKHTYMKIKMCHDAWFFFPVLGCKDEKAMILTLPSARLKSHPYEWLQSPLLLVPFLWLFKHLYLAMILWSFILLFLWVVLNLGCILKYWWLSHTPELQI